MIASTLTVNSSSKRAAKGRGCGVEGSGTTGIEVIPAVLVKSKQELLEAFGKVKPHVRTIHIDVMDNKFVPNATVGIEGINAAISEANAAGRDGKIIYEFHWMVEKPLEWIRGLKIPRKRKAARNIQLVHIETVKSPAEWAALKKEVLARGDELGLVINPETDVEKLLENRYADDCKRILVMAVHPGFSGQKYIAEVEGKIAHLRKKFPRLDIEIDGGVDAVTSISAARAGANKLAAASAIFKSDDIASAIRKLKEAGEKGASS